MYTVYVLRDGEGKLYKGLTSDVARRLREHRGGKTITTSRMKNIQLVYREEFDSLIEARAREIYLKSAAGRRFLKKQLVKYLRP